MNAREQYLSTRFPAGWPVRHTQTGRTGTVTTGGLDATQYGYRIEVRWDDNGSAWPVFADELEPVVVTKVSLRGPAPFGGAYISTLDDPIVPRVLADGYRVERVWDVAVGADGRPFVVREHEDPAGIVAARFPQA